MLSLTAFSQKGIDTIPIKIQPPIARLIVKDLIRGDACHKELDLAYDKVNLLNLKIQVKDAISLKKDSLIKNNLLIIGNQEKQLKTSGELNKELSKDLKKQKVKSTILGVSTTAAAAAIITLILIK